MGGRVPALADCPGPLQHFASFPDAIIAAGFSPALRFWARDEARAAIIALAVRLAHTPTTSELAEAATRREVPAKPTIASLFGGTIATPSSPAAYRPAALRNTSPTRSSRGWRPSTAPTEDPRPEVKSQDVV